MKKYLLPEHGNLYKANFHCHSTCSDGKFTPEELKRRYMEKGYSIIAFTDHEAFFTHNDLSDDNFLALNATEISIDAPMEGNGFWKICHLNLIAKDKNQDKIVCFHPNYLWWYPDEVVDKFVNEKKYIGEFYNRLYTVDGINDIIKKARENGFFVTYNHIGWSRENLDFVYGLENLDAFEIHNHRGIVTGSDMYNGAVYDDLLRKGKRWLPVSGDDNHNDMYYADRGYEDNRGFDNAFDSFGGFTYIKAPELSYESIISAMEKGDIYASAGPEIKSLYYEDGKYYIETSPVREIFLRAGNRNYDRVASPDGKPITSAVLDGNENDIFVHFSAVDFSGNAADTRAYYLKDFAE